MSNPDLVQYIVEQASKAGEVCAKKMFGDYCLYFSGKPIGLGVAVQLKRMGYHMTRI